MAGISLTSLEPSATQFIGRLVQHRWTPLLLSLLALLLLSYSLAQWSWRWLTPAAPVAAPVAKSEIVNPQTVLRDLLTANLFGMVDSGKSGLSHAQLPNTSLNLVLTGVMVRGKNGLALIRIDGGDETAIGVGQEVQAGTKLQAVYPDRAILQRAGILESLMLKDNTPDLPEGSILSGNRAARGTPAHSAVISSQGNQYTVNRESMMQQMQRPEFLSQALIVPNAGGGFLVREVQSGSVYERLGVKVGDVIRSINGQNVNSMDDVMKLYQQLGGLEQSGQVNLEVARAGRTETLNYTFQ